MRGFNVDLRNLCFQLYMWLQIAIVCLNSHDCQLPIKPIYGTYYLNGNKLSYRCMKGYGLIGSQYRTCTYSGIWTGSSPFCVRAAEPVFEDKVKYLTDDNITTCIYDPVNLIGISVKERKISSRFFINGTFSRATIRIIMTPYLVERAGNILIDKEVCLQKTKIGDHKIAIYDYNCSFMNMDGKVITITVRRNVAFTICEIQLLPHENTACPLLDLSSGSGTIIYDPEVTGSTTEYGTAARYSCNDNRTLHGSEIRYCIGGNQWSGSEAHCEVSEESEEIPLHVKHFVVIASSSAAAGFAIICIVIVTCIILRRKRAKPCSPQDMQLYNSARSRISLIDHYYDTLNSNRTSVQSENGEYDYCTVIETDTSGAPTSWKFEQLSVDKLPRSSVYLIDNESYEGS